MVETGFLGYIMIIMVFIDSSHGKPFLIVTRLKRVSVIPWSSHSSHSSHKLRLWPTILQQTFSKPNRFDRFQGGQGGFGLTMSLYVSMISMMLSESYQTYQNPRIGPITTRRPSVPHHEIDRLTSAAELLWNFMPGFKQILLTGSHSIPRAIYLSIHPSIYLSVLQVSCLANW